jgi:hypothetical protein
MLRDLSITNSDGSGILGIPFVGVLASVLPSGFALPGLLNNDVAAGDPAGCLYRVEILSKPGAGMLTVDEYGAFGFTGAPDGTYTGSEKVYKFDPAVGLVSTDTTTYSFVIGTPPAVVDTTPPVMVGSIALPNITTSGGRATWQAATDDTGVTGYEISVDTGTPAYTAIGNVLAYDIVGKAASTSYTVRLRAVDAAGNKATPITAPLTTATPAPPPSRSVSITLNVPAGTPAANLSGLRWAWFDQATPNLFTAPLATGTTESTDGTGVLQITLANSALAVGGVGWLIVTDSSGDPTLAHNAFSGPVAVA